MLVASAAGLLGAATAAPVRSGRVGLLASGGAALGALGVLISLPDPVAVAALLLLLAGFHATRPGRRPFALRLRGPTFASLLMVLGWVFARSGSAALGKVGGLVLALGLAAAAGLLPYLQDLEPEEPASASCLAWTAFFGPALAVALPARVLPALSSEAEAVFAATLVGVGLVNLTWGTTHAWQAADGVAAWRSSFLAEWGLALVGLGLAGSQQRGPAAQAAFLVLVSVAAVRLPLYVWARPVLLGRAPFHSGALNLAAGLALAGSAPFVGFAARLLLLRAATQLAWPLALLLLLAMLLWGLHAFRLGNSLGRLRGRTAAGLILALLVSLALGLAPGPLLLAGGL